MRYPHRFIFFGVLTALLLFVLPVVAVAQSTGQVTREVDLPDVCPSDIVTVTITPTGVQGFYAVQEDLGALTLIDHAADQYEAGVFLLLAAKSFTYRVQVPTFANEGQAFVVSGVFWDDPADKKDIGRTTLTVVRAPAAKFSASVTSGLGPLTVKFSDQSTGKISSWAWDFGDGTTSAKQNPTHTYDSKGSYTAELTVVGPCDSDRATTQITVVPNNLTVGSTAGGSVTGPGEGIFPYDAGAVKQLVASPDQGFRFVNWTGAVGTIADVTDPTTTITVNGDYSITANFIRVYTLVVNSPVPPQGGAVAPAPGTYTYDTGAQIELLATNVEFYRFDYWAGDVPAGSKSDNPLNLVMDSDRVVTPRFESIRCAYDVNLSRRTDRSEAIKTVADFLFSRTEITKAETIRIVVAYLIRQTFTCP